MFFKSIAALSMLALTASPHFAAAQEGPSLPERFTAFAVSTGGPRSQGVAAQVDIVINRWSTPAEAQRLTSVLKEKGAEALLDTLRELKPVGTINTPGNIGYDLHYAYQVTAADGARRVFLATDRPITHWQAVNRPRVVNYPFTFIELHLNANGEGEGKLALATQINVSDDGKTIELVSYRAEPIALSEVKHLGMSR